MPGSTPTREDVPRQRKLPPHPLLIEVETLFGEKCSPCPDRLVSFFLFLFNFGKAYDCID